MGTGGADAVLLRFTYDSLELLLADVRDEGGQPMLLFAAPSVRLPAGRPAVAELSFRSADQYRLATGVVGTQSPEGTWILLQRGAIEELRKGGLPTRKQRRLGCDEAVAIRRGPQAQVARMRDLSPSGARIVGAPALQPGEQIVVARWGGGGMSELGPAEVTWVERGEAGISFDRRAEACRLAVGKLFASLMQRWAAAPEVIRTFEDFRMRHG